MGGWARAGAIAFVVWVVCGAAAPAPCVARSRGIAAEGCDGCHNGGAEPEVRLTPLGEAVPGQALRLLIEIEATNGPVAGLYIKADVPGTLSSVADQGTQLFTNGGVAHTSPKTGSGFVRFEVSWMAPTEPTGVEFHIWAVSANDNDRSSGDGASETIHSLVSGCDGEMYFRDADRDGYGSTARGTRLDCAEHDGYSKVEGDCDDNDEKVNPSVTEYCNERDDDCDETVDEGSVPQEHYPDADGDGHGARRSEPVLECPPPPGYAPIDDDCYDSDSSAYPGAIEICDGTDNDCDVQVDERVRPQCGVGWCVRESFSCDVQDCEPGEPSAETCNYLDDDCDDALDEEVVDCGSNEVCREGTCVVASAAADQDSSTPVGTPDAQVAMNADAGGAGSMGMAPPTASSSGGCSVRRSRAPSSTASVALFALALWLVRRRLNSRKGARARPTALAGLALLLTAGERVRATRCECGSRR